MSAAMVAAVLAAATACGTKADQAAADLPSRTNRAKVLATQPVSTDAFCDQHATDAKAVAFRWPELAPGGAPPAAPAAGWRWVNVWATWCTPCIEEMPRLVAWRDKLAAAGRRVELAFVSVDDSDAEVAGFRTSHPGLPPSVRIADADNRGAWLKSLGLGDGAIPIQLFVSPANRLRCARAGGIRENDYGVIEALLAE